MFEAILTERQSRLDKLQLAALCLLMFLGAAFIYSATMTSSAANALAL